MKNSNFIRDLLVKLLLIVIFVFLLMYLFPMPNLTPFYSAIFNDNIQTMKDAAEDYYTTDRMPKEVGKSSKMTLQEMIDNKLIIPFVDKDGNSCNTSKSYVKVTKLDNEYELKVSLTCGKESDYVIEKIGCYNFCPTGSCTLAEIKANEEQAIKENSQKVTTKTDENGNVTVVVPTGYYLTEYEYIKKLTDEKWTTGDYRNTKLTETDDIKLVDTRTQYTGQKKVTSGTTLYEQISYGYKDNWTYDKDWTTTTKKETDTVKIAEERTIYTGQKKIEDKDSKYEHVKYGYRDNWTYDTDWSTETKKTSDTVKLWQERTLYTGQKKVTTGTTEYEHVKYGYKDNWTYDTDWTTTAKTTSDTVKLWQERTLYTGEKEIKTTETKYQHVKYKTTENWNETGYTTTERKTSSDVVLVGTRYTVRKNIQVPISKCENYQLDSNWYSSVPANTSTRTYSSTPANSRTKYEWVQDPQILRSRTAYSYQIGDVRYEESTDDFDNCGGPCDTTVRYYYYRVYRKKAVGTEYQYKYCTPTNTVENKLDEKVVTDLAAYKAQGYTLVKTEYNYKVRSYTKSVEDTKWTTSKTSPSGYEYTGTSNDVTTVKYEPLNKWVTNKDKLGEYTSNIKTVKQYKYAYNNREKYVVDTKWTTSKTSPSGYEYTGKNNTTTDTKYEALNKWVTSKEALGEYTYNVKEVKQYKYAYNNKEKYVIDTKWTDSKTSPSGYEFTGNISSSTKVRYEQLETFVDSKEKLGEYTYNIKEVKQYKYKYNNPTKYVKDTIWTTDKVAKDGYTLTGNEKTTTKVTYIDLGDWVNSKDELKEYKYNIKTRTQYRYKYRSVSTSTEIKWGTRNPGDGFEPTGNSRKTYISTGTKTVTTTNKQK